MKLRLGKATMDRVWIGCTAALGLLVLGGCSLGPRLDVVATAEPSEGYAPLRITFEASSLTGSTGEIVSHRWDFGDGTISTELTAVHTFEEKGDHRVLLEVADREGLTARNELIVRVLNRIPHAQFHVSPFGAPRDYPVTFDASESYDPDGEIAEYRWDFGDGTGATGMRVEHVFPQRRQYQVALTVIDDDGTENRTARTVIVDGCDTCG